MEEKRDSLDSESEAERSNGSELKFCPSVLLNIFRLTRRQRSRLSSVIKTFIGDIVKQRNSDGQPLRWCYVPTLPTGGAYGKCLALDFGCSNHFIQVTLCDVIEGSDATYRPIDSRTFLLTATLRHADMMLFSDFVAMCLKKILLDNAVRCTDGEEPIFMGISAGFDVRVKAQLNPASATVTAASKDFTMPGFLGSDFVPSFHAAFKRAGLNIRIVTVINDTVDTLLSGIYQVSNGPKVGFDCSIGVLCHRVGSNIAYLETDSDFLDMCNGDERQLLSRPTGKGFCAAVNTECGYWIGANGELAELANAIDTHIQGTLRLPFRLENVTSGAWYQHSLHRAIQILCTTKVMNATVDKNWKLDKSNWLQIFVHCDKCRFNSDWRTSLSLAAELKPILGFEHLSAADASLIAEVCQAIVNRTATVLAICINAIAERIYGESFPKKIAIAYGGTLFKLVSQLSVLLKTSLDSVLPNDTEILLVHSEVLMGCAMTALNAGRTA